MTPWDGQPTHDGDIPKPVAARVLRGPAGRMRRVKPDQVVVNRADLKWALGMIEDEWTGLNGSLLDPEGQATFNRLAKFSGESSDT